MSLMLVNKLLCPFASKFSYVYMQQALSKAMGLVEN
jgi:hypothetical protein